MRRRRFLTSLLPATALAARQPHPELAEWVRAQGGSVETAPDGSIVGVKLAYTWVTDPDMARLAPLETLQKLDLSVTTITYRGLARLAHLTAIRDLALFYTEFVVDIAMAQIRPWRGLERLILQGTDITDTSLSYIGDFTKLRELDLSFTQITDNGLEYLANLIDLESLTVGGNKVSGAGLPVVRLLPKLRKLDLSGVQKRNSGFWIAAISDFEAEWIAGCRTLQALDVSDTKVTDAGVGLFATSLAELTDFTAGRTAITAKGIEALAKARSLRRLNLWQAVGIDDAAAPAIAQLRQIEELDLSGTNAGDAVAATLAGLPNLRRLILARAPITGPAQERLRQALPECLILT